MTALVLRITALENGRELFASEAVGVATTAGAARLGLRGEEYDVAGLILDVGQVPRGSDRGINTSAKADGG